MTDILKRRIRERQGVLIMHINEKTGGHNFYGVDTNAGNKRGTVTLSARTLLKKELEALHDPTEDMTKEEHQAYQKKLLAKINAGKRLSAKEMNYLRIHAPELYRMARQIEQKRMKLEQQLKNCKSKEEASEIFCQAMEGISDGCPYKEALIKNYQNVYDEFRKSKEYARLPETKKEAEAQKLHGKRKKMFLEGKVFTEVDKWFTMQEAEMVVMREENHFNHVIQWLEPFAIAE